MTTVDDKKTKTKSGYSSQSSLIDEAGKESFPSSDPPAWTLGTDREEMLAKDRSKDLVLLLLHEHDVIKEVGAGVKKWMLALQEGKKPDIPTLKNIIHFLQKYVDECHHVKEELIFAALKKEKERPTDYMLNDLQREHKYGEELSRNLKQIVDNYSDSNKLEQEKLITTLEDILSLYMNHSAKEEEYVFPYINKSLTPEDREKYFMEFKKIEDKLGAHVYVDLTDLAERIKKT